MTQFDLAIRGGSIVTASDEFRGDIGIRDGRIVALADRIEGAAREIDASGLLVLPGGIDSHVHISQDSGPDIVMADDFASATRSAAAGGNTTVLPFAKVPGIIRFAYTGLVLLGFLSLTCGLILDTVTRGRKEMKRLQYLTLPAAGAKAK